MVNNINRALGIQARDSEKLLQLGPVFLLTGLVYTGGIISVYSLFVSRFGVKYLPVMFLIEAGILPLQLWMVSILSQRLAKGTMINVFYLIISLGVMVCALIVLSMHLLDFQWRMFYPLLYIIVNVLLRILVPLMWMLGDGICLLQQAKRIYPILGVLFTLGGIMAGLLARIFATHFQGFGTEMLFLLVPIVLFFSLFLWRRLITNYFLSADVEERKNRGVPVTTVIKTVWGSPFLRISLIGFVLLLSLFNVLDYQFFLFMDEKFPDSDAMTQYFGLFTVVLQTVSLLIGLFLNRLIDALGVGNTVFLMGVTTVIAFLGTGFMAHGPWALYAFSMGDIMLDVLGFTLLPPILQLFNKFLPAEQRAGASLLFAGSINAGGKLIGAGISGLHSSRTITLIALSMIGFALACIYFYLTWKQKHLYFSTLLGSLQTHTMRASELNDFSLGKRLGKGDVRPIIEALQSTNAIRESIALELSVHLKHELLFTALQPFLSHPDPRKRLLAFQAISGYKNGSEEIFLRGLQDPEPEIRGEAVRQLKIMLQKGQRLNELLAKMLHDPSSQVIKETIVALHDNADLTIQKELDGEIQAMLTGDDEHRFQVCLAIQEIQARQYATQVTAMLASETSSRVRISAVKCLGELGCLESISLLLGLYPNADNELRQSIESALIQMGSAAIPELRKNLGSNDTDIWYLSVVSLSSLDQDPQLTMHLNESCSRKIVSFHGINKIPALLEKEGFNDLADLYRFRVEEDNDYIQAACWKTLAISIDPLIIGRLKESLKKTPAVDKREQALELLTELSRRHPLIVEMLRGLYGDSPMFLEKQMTCIQSLNNSILAFPDPWLNRFSNYAIAHLQKGEA